MLKGKFFIDGFVLTDLHFGGQAGVKMHTPREPPFPPPLDPFIQPTGQKQFVIIHRERCLQRFRISPFARSPNLFQFSAKLFQPNNRFNRIFNRSSCSVRFGFQNRESYLDWVSLFLFWLSVQLFIEKNVTSFS